MYYRQCELEIVNSCGDILKSVSFIPEEFAVIGKSLKLRDENKIWDSGWVVKTVSSIRVDEKHLPDSHKEIKSHRNSTGDTTPKVKE